jgi:hypothetical protein
LSLRAEWVGFLKRFNWSLFVTLTFRRGVKTPWGAQNKVREYCEHVTNASRLSPSYIFFLEEHKSGLWHVHGLLANIKPFYTSSTMLYTYYKATDGGRCKFSELKGGDKGFWYMTKYLTKGYNMWYIIDERVPHIV